MKTKDIRAKSPADIAKLMESHENELRSIRFGTASSTMKNVKRARALRKDIARMKTLAHAARLTK